MELFTVQKLRKIADVLMLKFLRVAVTRTVNDGEHQTFYGGSKTALSMESNFDPAANANVLNSNLVRL